MNSYSKNKDKILMKPINTYNSIYTANEKVFFNALINLKSHIFYLHTNNIIYNRRFFELKYVYNDSRILKVYCY